MPEGEPGTLKDTVKRDEEFVTLYSNNIRFETTPVDIKLLFGEVDQSGGEGGKPTIVQHTGMTVSWIQAKVMTYFLLLNIAAFEIANGKIKLPAGVLPPPPVPPEGELANNQVAQELHNTFVKIYDEIIKSSI